MQRIIKWYRDVMDNWSDPRVKDWFMMSSPVPIIFIVTLYLYVCISAGPKFMKERKPYSLRKTLIAYNLFLVLLSTYMVCEGLMIGWIGGFDYGCLTVDYSNNPFAIRVARGAHLFFTSKLIELMDTIFFVLRKKQQQITFLHLYHHAVMAFFLWVGVKFVPGGQPYVMVVLNSFVHVIMYSYYMLAAMGPQVQKYLWWKKYLTILQLVQFAIIFVQNGQALFTDCAYPKVLSFILTLNALIFMYMFGSFYVASYTKKATEEAKKDAVSNGATKKKLN